MIIIIDITIQSQISLAILVNMLKTFIFDEMMKLFTWYYK